MSIQKREELANMIDYYSQIESILESSQVKLSNIRPSEWGEQNIVMPKPFPGPLSYDKTPYTREVVDCFSPDHPARIIAFMKGAQFGGTSTIILPVIGWIIQNNPSNIIMTVGHDSLVDEAMTKVDLMIDNAGLRGYIKPSAMRNRAGKTGDTNTKKEFSGGYLKISSASNHKIWRQADYQIGLIDDYEAIKRASKESGSTEEMIMQRFASYSDKMKILFMSTPELKDGSNIEPAYLRGDQRKYLVPCPCCGEAIELKWSIPIEGSKDTAGITWKVDNNGNVISGTVGYICQKCAGFFDDSHKMKMLQAGHWQPTATPSMLGYYSYHCSALYAPHGMYDWEHYVNVWVKAHRGGVVDEAVIKSFTNLCLAKTYEEKGETPSANQLQKNIRDYKIGSVPEKLSIKDGNGKIVMLTCAADMNGTTFNESKGTVDDARLDWEIVAWAENGASYSVAHGSIGTFIPREGSKKHKEDRVKWSYDPTKPNNVWGEFGKILDADYERDTGGKMKILISGLDTGHYTGYAYNFIDKRGVLTLGLKGDKEDSFTRLGVDVKKFKPAAERNKLYILKVGLYKDHLADLMNLKFDPTQDDYQPEGFCNYPTPEGGKYLYDNYFSHYEAEEKMVEMKDGVSHSFIWKKKSSAHQNHFFDCRIYNMALKDIVVDIVCRRMKMTNYVWNDFVKIMLG
jgi:phage terminase large subunit GpA-like protein